MNTVSFPGFGLEFHVEPIAFSVFGWPVHWYGIIIATGFLLAVWYCSHISQRYGITSDDIVDMLIYAVPISIIGLRIYYVLFYLDLYRREDGSLDFGAMLRIWDGGLAIYGGIIAAVLVVYVFCKRRGIRFLSFCDLGAFGLLIGQSVGRWGNFVNVEAYGSETTLPWRMGITDYVDGAWTYLEVHPTYLYESLWNLVGLLLLVFLVSKHRKFDGQIFFSYVAWYGLGRTWIEGLRTDSLYFFHTGLRVSQWLALLSFVGAAVWLMVHYRKPHVPEDLWVNTEECQARLKAANEVEKKKGEKTDGQDGR